jgi:hypothetical protein
LLVKVANEVDLVGAPIIDSPSKVVHNVIPDIKPSGKVPIGETTLARFSLAIKG